MVRSTPTKKKTAVGKTLSPTGKVVDCPSGLTARERAGGNEKRYCKYDPDEERCVVPHPWNTWEEVHREYLLRHAKDVRPRGKDGRFTQKQIEQEFDRRVKPLLTKDKGREFVCELSGRAGMESDRDVSLKAAGRDLKKSRFQNDPTAKDFDLLWDQLIRLAKLKTYGAWNDEAENPSDEKIGKLLKAIDLLFWDDQLLKRVKDLGFSFKVEVNDNARGNMHVEIPRTGSKQKYMVLRSAMASYWRSLDKKRNGRKVGYINVAKMDGHPVSTRLELLAHILAHETVHIAQTLSTDSYDEVGHGRDFKDFSKRVFNHNDATE